MRFEKPLTIEEIKAAKIAREKVLAEAIEKEKAGRPQREREAQAMARIKEQLSKDAPVYEITPKDIEEAEKFAEKLKK